MNSGLHREQVELLIQLMDAKCLDSARASVTLLLCTLNSIGQQPGIDMEQLTLSLMANLRNGIKDLEPGIAQQCAQEMHDIVRSSYQGYLDKA